MLEFSSQIPKFGTTKFWSCRREIVTWNVQLKDTASLCRHWCWNSHKNTEGSLFVPSVLVKWCLCTSGAKPDGQRVQHCLLVLSHWFRGEDELQVSSNLNSLVIPWLLNKEQPTESARDLEGFPQNRGKLMRLSDCRVSSRLFRQQLPAKQTLKGGFVQTRMWD